MTAPDFQDVRDAVATMMPIVVHVGPDYAEVHFGDGTKHRSQCMTMNPDDWCALNRVPALLADRDALAAENERLRAENERLRGAVVEYTRGYGPGDGDSAAMETAR